MGTARRARAWITARPRKKNGAARMITRLPPIYSNSPGPNSATAADTTKREDIHSGSFRSASGVRGRRPRPMRTNRAWARTPLTAVITNQETTMEPGNQGVSLATQLARSVSPKRLGATTSNNRSRNVETAPSMPASPAAWLTRTATRKMAAPRTVSQLRMEPTGYHWTPRGNHYDGPVGD